MIARRKDVLRWLSAIGLWLWRVFPNVRILQSVSCKTPSTARQTSPTAGGAERKVTIWYSSREIPDGWELNFLYERNWPSK